MKTAGFILLLMMIVLFVIAGFSMSLFHHILLLQKNNVSAAASVNEMVALENCVGDAREWLGQQRVPPPALPFCFTQHCIHSYQAGVDPNEQPLTWWQEHATHCDQHHWRYWELLQTNAETHDYYYRISVRGEYNAKVQATYRINATSMKLMLWAKR